MPTSVQLIWGCDPSRQLERQWLLSLLRPLSVVEVHAGESLDPVLLKQNCARILVETGLMRLEREVSQNRLINQSRQRQHVLRRSQKWRFSYFILAMKKVLTQILGISLAQVL